MTHLKPQISKFVINQLSVSLAPMSKTVVPIANLLKSHVGRTRYNYATHKLIIHKTASTTRDRPI